MLSRYSVLLYLVVGGVHLAPESPSGNRTSHCGPIKSSLWLIITDYLGPVHSIPDIELLLGYSDTTNKHNTFDQSLNMKVEIYLKLASSSRHTTSWKSERRFATVVSVLCKDRTKMWNTSLNVLSATQTLCSFLLGVITRILSPLYIFDPSTHNNVSNMSHHMPMTR